MGAFVVGSRDFGNQKIRGWQEAGHYESTPYGATTPHYFWDGQSHYWSGASVWQERKKHIVNRDLGERVKLKASQCKLIRAILEKRGWRHVDLAERMQVTQPTVNSWINRRTSISVIRLAMMSRILGVEL